MKAWNNEEKRLFVNNFIFEQSKQYSDFKGLQKTLIQTAKIQSSRGAADVFIPMAVLVEDPTAIGSTESASGKNRILLIDGQMLIVTNKGTYTLLGKRVDGRN